MTNFDFLKTEEKFESFADVAMAMEFAVKWMYSVDSSLVMPWDDKLVNLMNTEEFRDIVDRDLWFRMDFIRKMGNSAAHAGKKLTKDQALLCLENLFIFMDFLSYCYGDEYEERTFDPALPEAKEPEPVIPEPIISEVDLEALIRENTALKEALTARRAEQQQTYVPKPLDISEFKTRKIYIDSMLEDARTSPESATPIMYCTATTAGRWLSSRQNGPARMWCRAESRQTSMQIFLKKSMAGVP